MAIVNFRRYLCGPREVCSNTQMYVCKQYHNLSISTAVREGSHGLISHKLNKRMHDLCRS